MGNQQSLINYNSQLVFSKNLSDQLNEIQTKYHPGLGKIKIWQIKNPNNIKVFSICTHTYEKDSAVQSIHQFRSSLNHQNLISYLACIYSSSNNVETQQYFFEYHANTLKEMIKKGKLNELQIWKYIEQIVNVMAYLQSFRRAHGNLSSDAILLNENNQVKLLDSLGQKPNYLSIKQDIYDLGLVIIEMMTQKTTQLNFIQTLKKLVGEYSCQLLQLVAKLIQKDPLTRPNFIELKSMLENRFTVPIIYKVDKFNNPTFSSNNNTRRVSPNQTNQELPTANYTSVPSTQQVNYQIIPSIRKINQPNHSSPQQPTSQTPQSNNQTQSQIKEINYTPTQQRCRTTPAISQNQLQGFSKNIEQKPIQQVKCNSPNNSRINTTLHNFSTAASPIQSNVQIHKAFVQEQLPTFGTQPQRLLNQYISQVYTRPWSESYQK